MTNAESPSDAAAKPLPPERDLWWGGYAGRTMVPSFAVCVVATVAFIGLAVQLWKRQLVHGETARWGVYLAAGLLWFAQMFRWAYRLSGYNYRLTDRRLYIIKGFSRRRLRIVSLDSLEAVAVIQNLAERSLGVGRLRVIAEGLGQLTLPGV